ncbi:hypothetical protein TNCV_4037811 [Trichonephila clavipes]|nr:hypothetical protein TNCV_4037811 [Trichonephila clavipes]
MSSFLVLSEGDTLGTGGVMDKCVQMLDKELWRLGRRRGEREETEGEVRGDGKREEKESGREREEPALYGEKGCVRRLE